MAIMAPLRRAPLAEPLQVSERRLCPTSRSPERRGNSPTEAKRVYQRLLQTAQIADHNPASVVADKARPGAAVPLAGRQYAGLRATVDGKSLTNQTTAVR